MLGLFKALQVLDTPLFVTTGYTCVLILSLLLLASCWVARTFWSVLHGICYQSSAVRSVAFGLSPLPYLLKWYLHWSSELWHQLYVQAELLVLHRYFCFGELFWPERTSAGTFLSTGSAFVWLCTWLQKQLCHMIAWQKSVDLLTRWTFRIVETSVKVRDVEVDSKIRATRYLRIKC